ncbi:MAG: hypothetical protein A2Y14_01660 [Verrucomicrobia bacterium GWF2_51_19]|nr:MAG: hypothetical protein A2Y14_01660 [Verrucomicrobia bacterium GWF2_51_19]HCJ11522.1 hypothetical protein [Opitutae bacterium]
MFTDKDFRNYLEQIRTLKDNLRKAASKLQTQVTDKRVQSTLEKVRKEEAAQIKQLQDVLDKITDE